MSLFELNSRLLRKEKVPSTVVLTTLVEFYEEAVDFNENHLHNDLEALDCIVEDMAHLGQYITTVGTAKSIAKTVMENKLSNSDEKWRLTNLADYKQSSKSSTTHQINLRGLDDNKPFVLIFELINSLYYDMLNKNKNLQSQASTLKFGIEHQLWQPVIRKSNG
jgi:hypothetical protein